MYIISWTKYRLEGIVGDSKQTLTKPMIRCHDLIKHTISRDKEVVQITQQQYRTMLKTPGWIR